MKPWEGPFATVVAARNALYDRGLLRAHRLKRPVISVGNISVGGSGKTPFVLLLGAMLQARGVRFDVLTRGYRRQSKDVTVVDPHGSPHMFGDEPLLLARRLGVPVVVGAERFRAGLLAEKTFNTDLHLLDDGFQHRQLARDFDIVLVTPEDETDALLPIGRLREARINLRRADTVVAMRGARSEPFAPFARRLWRVERGIEMPELPSRPLVFGGIARPEFFFRQLREQGVCPGAQIGFRDHHAYTQRDIDSLRSIAGQRATNGFVTTEKDAINLGELAAQLAPLLVVRTTLTWPDGDAAVDDMLATIATRCPDFRP